MSQYVIASRYAKSLIDLAKEKGLLDTVKGDIELFLNALKSSKDLSALFKSPIVNQAKKKSVINSLFSSRVHPVTMSIFNITIDKGRDNILDAVALEFIKQYNKLNGIEVATIITAAPISKEAEAGFEKVIGSLTSSKILLQTKVDPKLIGGFVVKVGDRQIDESVSSKLNKLKMEFSKNPYQKTF
jgi:F-type H+-transporting ATPase subunit delta